MITYKDMAAHVPAPGETPDWAWFLHAIPSLRLLEATPQDPYYHAEGNVWIHTRMVVEALMRGIDYMEGDDDERFILFYAALLHDIAKPDTTVIDPDSGRIGQPGHSKRGAIDARILCWHAGVPFAVREHLCRIITVHQLPFFALAGNKNGQSAEFLIRKLSHELDLRLLSAVAQADMEGRDFEKTVIAWSTSSCSANWRATRSALANRAASPIGTRSLRISGARSSRPISPIIRMPVRR